METLKMETVNETINNMMIFSSISLTGKIEDETNKMAICADALNDWACCMAGTKPPANFGIGMAQVGEILGIIATPDNLMKYADNGKNIIKELKNG